MYKIQKTYYEGLDETRVRLTQENPYRDFEVTLKGNIGDTDNEVIERKAMDILSREFNPSKALEELNTKLEEQERSIKHLSKALILAKDLTGEQKEVIASQYDEYVVGKYYEPTNKFTYKGKVYEVIQPHPSQADYIPGDPSTASLYKEYLNLRIIDSEGNEVEVIADFKQPTGAHDAYQKGNKVRFEGKIYECKGDNIVHSPGEYPDGWNLIEG